MAYTTVIFENPHTGERKQAPVGFSWTTAFFGFFPALIRGDFKWAAIQLILALMTWGCSTFVFMFIYNKLYLNDLISKGYSAKGKTTTGLDIELVSSRLSVMIPTLGKEAAV